MAKRTTKRIEIETSISTDVVDQIEKEIKDYIEIPGKESIAFEFVLKKASFKKTKHSLNVNGTRTDINYAGVSSIYFPTSKNYSINKKLLEHHTLRVTISPKQEFSIASWRGTDIDHAIITSMEVYSKKDPTLPNNDKFLVRIQMCEVSGRGSSISTRHKQRAGTITEDGRLEVLDTKTKKPIKFINEDEAIKKIRDAMRGENVS